MAVFCLAEVSLFCFDRSVVTLLRRASVTPPYPPSHFLLSVLPLPLTSRVTANTVFLVLMVAPSMQLWCSLRVGGGTECTRVSTFHLNGHIFCLADQDSVVFVLF